MDKASRAMRAPAAVRTLTFAILGGLPDYHPGYLRVEDVQAAGRREQQLSGN